MEMKIEDRHVKKKLKAKANTKGNKQRIFPGLESNFFFFVKTPTQPIRDLATIIII